VTTAVEGPVVPEARAVRHVTKDGKEFSHPDSIGADHLQTLKLLCLDLETGKILWQRTAHQGTVQDNRHRKNTFASPTPITDGKNVYAYFGSEGIYAFDFEGKPLWKASLGLIATMGMGVASSPALYGNLLILQCDQDNGVGSFIAAVDKSSGKLAWKTSRNTLESWSSPIVVNHEGRPELIVAAREVIISYDPETGKEYWRANGVGANPAPTPVAGYGSVFVTAGAQEKRTVAIRLGGSGDISNSSKILWRHDRGAPHVPSPLLYRDYFYLMTDNGLLTCLDAHTGEMKYQGARPPGPATFSASPVAFEDKIVLSSEDGDSYVVKAGPTYELLSTNSIGEPIYASPAIAGGRILIRGEKSLFCIRSGSSSSLRNALRNRAAVAPSINR
jgi:outer membrane protein assembly factor BamB